MYGKIKDMRLLEITVVQDGNVIYQGKVEDAPEEIANSTYKKIEFVGVDVKIEI